MLERAVSFEAAFFLCRIFNFMKIALLTLGTRGDVQPYAVLGQVLQQRGHHVILVTAKNFKSLVESYGLEFRPVEADYAALLKTDEGKKILGANPFAIQRNLRTWIYPLVRTSLDQFYTTAQECDVVLYHAKTLADSFADAFPHRMVRAMVVPAIEPTQAFANPAFSGLPIPAFLRKWSYSLMGLGLRMFRGPIAEFRQAHGLTGTASQTPLPALYGVSSVLLPQPTDWKSESLFTGFWVDPENAPQLDAEVEAFLEAGAPPVVVTFGSMPVTPRFSLAEALEAALEQFPSLRLIVVRGWGLESISSRPDGRLLAVSDVPYDRLFARAQAVVHHGGVGTTAACLLAGVPFWVCPVLYPVGDQLFWGQRAAALGVALPPVALKKVSRSRFIHQLGVLAGTVDEQAETHSQLRAAAQEIREQLRHENGPVRAAEWLEARIAPSEI